MSIKFNNYSHLVKLVPATIARPEAEKGDRKRSGYHSSFN